MTKKKRQRKKKKKKNKKKKKKNTQISSASSHPTQSPGGPGASPFLFRQFCMKQQGGNHKVWSTKICILGALDHSGLHTGDGWSTVGNLLQRLLNI